MTFIQELPVEFNKRHANNIAKKLMEWQDTHVSVSDRGKNDLYFILHITVPTNPGFLLFHIGKTLGQQIEMYTKQLKNGKRI